MANEHGTLAKVLAEWRSNPRLRYGAMLIVAILGVNGLLSLSDRVVKQQAAYTADTEMLARLEAMHKEDFWPKRAEAAQEQWQQVQEAIPLVNGKGMAQADTQARLGKLAEQVQLTEPRIKVEDTVDVDGYPELWQVVASLEGLLPDHGQEAFLRALAEAQPWVQAERIDIEAGNTPRIKVTLRSYYRKKDTPEKGAPASAEASAP